MINSKSVKWVNSNNLIVDGAAITKGECRSAEGKEFDFTDELMNKILSHFNEAVPIKIGHGDTPEVGRAFKLGFDPTIQNLPFEGHVYGDDNRKIIESYGYNKISPEIDFTFDAAGNPIDGVITALALVKVPAMDGTEVTCKQMTFSAPTPSINDNGESMKQEGIMVFYPKGTSVPEEDSNSSSAPANFEAVSSKYKQMLATFEAENIDLKGKVDEATTANADLNAQLNDYKTKFTALEAENNSYLQEKTETVVTELKTMGFKSPEMIAADLPAKQRIEVLKQMKSNFVMNAPSENPAPPIDVPKPTLVGKAAAIAALPEELRKYVKSGE